MIGNMAKENHIDGELFGLFIKERIHVDCANGELALNQVGVF